MKSFSNTFVLTFIAMGMISLSSCIFSSGDSGGASQSTNDVTSLNLTSDPITITITESTKSSFNDSNLFYIHSRTICGDSGVLEPYLDTTKTNYLIRNDSLLIWYDEYQCYANVYTGTSGTILGTWTQNEGDLRVLIADTSSDHDCSSTPGTVSRTETFSVSSNETTRSYTKSVCWSEDGLISEFEYEKDNLDFTMTSDGCNKVIYTKGDQTATLQMDFVNSLGAEKGTFSTPTKSCVIDIPEIPNVSLTQSTCIDAWNQYVADTSSDKYSDFYYDEYLYSSNVRKVAKDQYLECIQSTGFFGDTIPDSYYLY